MKSTPLFLAGLLWLGACTPDAPAASGQKEADRAANPAPAAGRARPAADCQGEPMPGSCTPDCTSDECYDAILKQHRVEDTAGYVITTPAFRYMNLSFNGKLDATTCEDHMVFVVFENDAGGLSSNVIVNDTSAPESYSFPAPLLKAIRETYQPTFKYLDCFWADKSPKCSRGDMLLAYALADGSHAFYNLSKPPRRISQEEARELGLLKTAVRQLAR